MSTKPSQFVKLGLHLEYLRGIASSSGPWPVNIESFPYLRENQPAWRYSVKNVVTVLKSMFELFEELKLSKSTEAAADLRPMLAEMEAFLANNADPDGAFLQDHFANNLVRIADEVSKTAREEIEK